MLQTLGDRLGGGGEVWGRGGGKGGHSHLKLVLGAAGARTVVHPKARIIAEAGPVIIGEFNIIEELVHITNR